jgi:hypothetical protein
MRRARWPPPNSGGQDAASLSDLSTHPLHGLSTHPPRGLSTRVAQWPETRLVRHRHLVRIFALLRTPLPDLLPQSLQYFRMGRVRRKILELVRIRVEIIQLLGWAMIVAFYQGRRLRVLFRQGQP